jgi:hypothetical protein
MKIVDDKFSVAAGSFYHIDILGVNVPKITK